MRDLYAAIAALVTGMMVAAPLMAQAPTVPSFEVASVKPNESGEGNGGTFVRPGGRYSATNVPLRALVFSAYGLLHDVQIIGGPSWMNTERFDIVAKAEGNPSTDVFRDQARLMLRTLLADRFRLTLHHETRELPIHALVIARRDGKLGPQLRPSKLADCLGAPKPSPASDSNTAMPCGGGFARTGHVAGRASEFPGLVTTVSNVADRPVVDRTGLTGTFDWDLQWTSDRSLSSASDRSPDSVSLFTALQEQLGLKLEPTRGPVDVLVIDHVERPTED
jgi:uncharacterized protein (TIGR03435 family)